MIRLLRLPVFGFVLCLIAACSTDKEKEYTIESPDKQLVVQFSLSAQGEPRYQVTRAGKPVLNLSKLGVVRQDGDFSSKMSLVSVSPQTAVTDQYELLTAKRRINNYKAEKSTISLKTASGQEMDIIFQVSDDGVAFRYYFPGNTDDVKKITKELTSFAFGTEAKGWLQPMSDAKTGWEKVNPAYEEYYQQGIAAGTTSPIKAGWVFPALFQTGDNWVLISETFPPGNYCGSRLQAASPGGEYSIGFPQPEEVFPGGALNPESKLPWYSPWRIIAIGSLKTITESVLGTDLAEPALPAVTANKPDYIKPGVSSWSWVLMKDDSTIYRVQKRSIDYAADMNWEYCLIDADWDTKIGYDKAKELAAYAAGKNVGVVLWYNSAGSWNTTPYHPKSKLLTHEDRLKEFGKLKEMGIKGIKVDFFGGDGQSVMQYYTDIIKDAAAFELLVNCHGSTLPRGLQRTYPNLVSMEGVKGFEFATFEQPNQDVQPSHCATLPFTRNVFDPMDYTPMVLYKIPNIERKTTNGFELALPVLFLSGIQHIAETPDGMSRQPAFIKEFLRKLPTNWDDVRFIDGYPGKLAVIARKTGNRWIVAGINGEKIGKNLSLDLSSFSSYKNGTLITDGAEPLSFTQTTVAPQKATAILVKPSGGFVLVFGE